MPVDGQTPTRIHLVDSPSTGWQAGLAYPDPNDSTKLVRDVDARRLAQAESHAETSVTVDADTLPLVVVDDASPAGAISVSLDSTVEDGYVRDVLNESTNDATLTPTSGDIDDGTGAASSQTLAAGASCTVVKTSSGSPAVVHWKMLKGAGTGGSTIELQTDGVDNGSQSLLNLVSGTNVTLTDDGDGNVTIDAATGTGGGGSYVLLASASASASSYVDLATRNASGQSGDLFQSDFDDYEARLTNIKAASGSSGLRMEFGTGGGGSPTWSTANYYWMREYHDLVSSPGSGLAGQQNDAAFTLMILVGTDGLELVIRISAPRDSSTNKKLDWQGIQSASDSQLYGNDGRGVWNDLSVATALRFFLGGTSSSTSSVNIGSGKIAVYGIAN